MILYTSSTLSYCSLFTLFTLISITIAPLGHHHHQTADAIAPTIDYSHNMRVLKLPKSTQPGELIYRLKGSDGDAHAQLLFGVSGIQGRALIDVVAAPKSWNEADVYLRSALDESVYNLTIYVTDGNKTTQVESTILVVEDEPVGEPARAHLSPFVRPKHVFSVPENANPGDTIGTINVLDSPKSDLPVRFELRGQGAEHFGIKYVFGPRGQSKGELVLAQRVDYERQNLFSLKVLALNAWTDIRYDTRNVATLDIAVTLQDVQDTAPVFRSVPLSVRLATSMQPGDLVAKVEAEDGDYADQRAVTYALDAASPLASYFDIGKLSGEIKLKRPASELVQRGVWDSAAWSTLTVFASELPDTTSYAHLWPPMYARAELPLVLVEPANEAPQFVGGWQTDESARHPGQRILHGFLRELATEHRKPLVHQDEYLPAGQVVQWYTNASLARARPEPASDQPATVRTANGRPMVLDLGLGSNGTFELHLEGPDAHLFQLEPSYPVTRQAAFNLFVAPDATRSSFDREHWAAQAEGPKLFQVDLVASDFGAGQRLSSRIRCSIELLDANDNAPQFDLELYTFSVYENAQVGQIIGNVRARDLDRGQRVRYVSLSGHDAHM